MASLCKKWKAFVSFPCENSVFCFPSCCFLYLKVLFGAIYLCMWCVILWSDMRRKKEDFFLFYLIVCVFISVFPLQVGFAELRWLTDLVLFFSTRIKSHWNLSAGSLIVMTKAIKDSTFLSSTELNDQFNSECSSDGRALFSYFSPWSLIFAVFQQNSIAGACYLLCCLSIDCSQSLLLPLF